MSRRRIALLALISISCANPRSSANPPAAEFLLVAGDSTFWVHSDTSGLRVRGSSMLLAHFDNRFYEVYVADDDRSYFDAIFIGERVYKRDLVTGDSSAVFDDHTVTDLARTYASHHPSERPLNPEEDPAERPNNVATTEVDVLDIHGPYLSYEYRSDLDLQGSAGTHTVKRGVLDLRDGTRSTLDHIFGQRAAREIIANGRRVERDALDSVRAFNKDPRARRAVMALESFRFDERSFALHDVEGGPTVEFTVPGEGDWAGGLSLPLRAIQAPRLNWWTEEVRSALPSETDRAGISRWRRAGYEVVARPDSNGETVTLALRDTKRHEWRLGRMGSPARRIFWLDRPGVDSAQRRSLARAFDESAFYGEDLRTASRGERDDGRWSIGGPRAVGRGSKGLFVANRQLVSRETVATFGSHQSALIVGGPPHREVTAKSRRSSHRLTAKRGKFPRIAMVHPIV